MKKRLPIVKMSLAILCSATALSRAQTTNTWNGNSSANWSDAGNWSLAAAPNPGDSLVFAGTAQTVPNNDLTAGTLFGGITFDATASTFDLTGNAINFLGAIANNSATAQSIDLPIVLTGSSVVNATGSDINVGMSAGGIGGTGPLTVNGPGTLSVSNISYAGGTIINSGATLNVWNDSGSYTLAGGSLFLNLGSWYSGANYSFTSDSSLGVNVAGSYNSRGRYDSYGTVGSAGYKWTVVGTGRFQIFGRVAASSVEVTSPAVLSALANGSANVTGLGTEPITVDNGAALRVNNGGIVMNPITLYGGEGPDNNGALVASQEAYSGLAGGVVPTATFSNTITLLNDYGDTSFGAQTSAATVGANMAVSGNITGPGGLVKIGTKLLNLSGNNTYAGNTTINVGTLQIGSPQALPNGPTNGVVYLNGSSVLDLNGYGATVNFLQDDSLQKDTLDNSSTSPASLTLLNGAYLNGAIGNSGGGALSVINVSGSALLIGANSYTGSNVVQGGSLEITIPTGNTGGLVSLADGTTLQLDYAAANLSMQASGAYFNGSNQGVNLNINLNGYPNPSKPVINATNGTGLVTIKGTVNIQLQNYNNLVGGTIHLIKYNTLTGGGSFTQPNLGAGITATIVTNVSTKTIDLVVQQPILTWTGKSNNLWDLSTTNWIFTGVAQAYADGNPILFDDTSKTNTVNLTTSVSPSSTLVNTTNTYTFTGAGPLSGGQLTVSGTGKLVIATTNASTYGNTLIASGTLQVGNGGISGALGSGSVDVEGTLAFNLSNNVSVASTISGAGNVVNNNTNTLTINNAANTYAGGTLVSQGTLKLNVANTLGVPGAGVPTVTVASGASLDINGQYLGATNPVIISGSGAPGKLGALTSVSGGGGMNLGYGNIGVNNLVLAGDATIGETSCNWQIGNSGLGLSGNGHVLTILMGNGNSLYFRQPAVTSPSQVIIGGGIVEFCENTNALGSAAVTLTNGGGFDTWNNNTGSGTGNPGLTIYNNVTVGIGGGTLFDTTAAYNGSHGNYDTYAGSFTLNANLTLNNNGQRGGGISKITITGPISGTGGIVCSQAPTNISTLSGVCSYTGPTVVNSGYLLLSGVQQGGGAYTNNDAAVLDVTAQTGYTTVPMSALALVGTNLGASLSFTRLTALTTNAPITATNLVLSGTNSILLSSAAFVNAGDFPLIKYGTLTGSINNLVVGAAGVRGLPGILSNNVANSSIDLIVPGGNPVVWTGTNSLGNWDIGSSLNWSLNAVATTYQQNGLLGDAVTFNDSSSVTNVAITTAVSPSVITVNNTNALYTFTGSSITGGTALLKKGTGTLLLTNGANTFTGGATIIGGTVKLGNAGSLNNSSGTVTVSGNGALDFNNQNPTALACTISGTGFNGLGTLVANYTNAAAAYGPASVTLAGSATIGGTNRWDIRNNPNQLNSPSTNYTLTKVGPGYVGLVGTAVSPNLGDVKLFGGTLSVQTSTPGLGNTNNTLYLAGGALSFYQSSVPLNKNIICSNNATITTESSANSQNNTINGPITLVGTPVNFNTGGGGVLNINCPISVPSSSTLNLGAGNGTLTLNGPVSIPSGTTVNNNANYYQTIVYSNVISGSGTFNLQYQTYVNLSASNTYSGNITIPQCNSGAGTRLRLLGNGSISQVPNITLQGFGTNQGSPGILDVGGRVDGTLTLAANQNLRGDQGATIVGSLVVPTGATVYPGGDFNTTIQTNVAPFANIPPYINITTNLTVNGGVLSFDVWSVTNDAIFAGNNLNLTAGTIRACYTATSGLTNGSRFHLIHYGGSESGSVANLRLALNGPHFSAHLDDTTSAAAHWVDLVIDSTNIVAPQTLTWAGDGVFNFWDPGTSPNWLTNSGSPQSVFYSGDNVSFTDPGTNPVVVLTGSLSPNSVTVNSSANYFFGGSGNIAGSTALTKSGTGSLTLSNANTYAGSTTINSGNVNLYNANALGSAGVTNNGTINLYANGGTGNVTPSGLNTVLAGSGTVNVTLGTSTGTTVLNGTNSGFTGILNIGVGAAAGAGKSQINTALASGATVNTLPNATVYVASGITQPAAITLAGGSTGEALGQLRIESSSTWAGPVTITGPITNAADGHVGANSGTGNISGNIGQSGGNQALVKIGGGTINLTGTNTYTGPTVVNQGTLTVVGNQTGATGSIYVGTNANACVLNIGTASQTVPTTAAVASNNVVLTASAGTAYSTINVYGASGFPTFVTNNGVMSIGRDSGFIINPNANWLQNGPLTVQANGGYPGNFTIAAGGNFTYNGTTLITNSAPTSSGNANITINGFLTTSQGFSFNNSGSSGSAILTLANGGTIALSGNVSQLALNTGTNANLPGQFLIGTNANINPAGFSTTLSLPLFNVSGQTGSLVVGGGGGTLTLAGTNTYTGTTTVTNGSLLVGNTGILPTNTVTVTAGGLLGGKGLVLGATTVQAGGNLNSGTTGIGSLTLSNALTFNAGSTNWASVSLAGGVTNNNATLGLSVVNYGGTLVLTNIGNTPLTVGAAFKLFSAASFTGNFANIYDASGTTWNFSPATGVATVMTVPVLVSTNPATANFQSVASNGTLNFSWAPDHQGWQLYTNAVGLTATSSWFPVSGTANGTNATISINPANPNVFYQLRYP